MQYFPLLSVVCSHLPSLYLCFGYTRCRSLKNERKRIKALGGKQDSAPGGRAHKYHRVCYQDCSRQHYARNAYKTITMVNPGTATHNVADNEDNDMFQHRQNYRNEYHHSRSQPYDSSQYPYRQQRSNHHHNQFHYSDEQDNLNTTRRGNYGILVAIFVVGLYQFRGPIIAWLRPIREMSPMDMLMELWDYGRAYMRMGIEVLRNLRFLLTSSTGILVGEDVDDLTRNRSANLNNNDNNNNHDGTNNNNNNGKTKRRRRFRDAASAFSAMPELEDDPALVGAATDMNSQHQIRRDSADIATNNGDSAMSRKALRSGLRPRSKYDDIEPAFLKEEDYPPGWLVYHPVLGVVPKTEADRYPKEEEVVRRRTAI